MIFQKLIMSIQQSRQLDAAMATAAKNAADIEYIAMMTEVELESEEDITNE